MPSPPVAGITITSSPLSGGPYTNGEIKVVTNNAAFGTEWCPYRGTPPANPVWRPTTNSPGNPGTFVPATNWMVMLRANQPVSFPSNPVAVTVVAGMRTRIAIAYP